MPEIAKITLPSGTTYDIKDAVAREALAGGMHFIGVTTTPLSDGASAATVTINGESYAAQIGDIVLYNAKEFVYSKDNKWYEFGDNTAFKALAYKDSASGSYTPAGSVSQPTFTGTEMESTGTFTPAGSVAAPTITLKTAGATATVNSITAVGTLPELTTTVENEILTISFSQGTLPTKGANQTVKTGDAAYSASAPAFTGTQGDLSVTGMPSGTVSKPTFAGTQANITVS